MTKYNKWPNITKRDRFSIRNEAVSFLLAITAISLANRLTLQEYSHAVPLLRYPIVSMNRLVFSSAIFIFKAHFAACLS